MHLLLPRIYALESERLPAGPPVPQQPSLVTRSLLTLWQQLHRAGPSSPLNPATVPCSPFPGSQQQASLWPAFHVHVSVPTVGAISSWQVAGKEAFASLLAAASFSLPSVARRTENCLSPSCSEEIKPISPALPVLLHGPSRGPGYLEVLPLIAAP